MKTTIKIHDGIVGALIVLTIGLGMKIDPRWFYLTGATGLLMISSTFTGFCPVYYILNRIRPTERD
jgi:hypothetical protein